jgi:hypothetical protein
MAKITNLLTFLSIVGISLFIATLAGYLLFQFLPWWVSIWGIIGITSLVAYFTIILFERAK